MYCPNCGEMIQDGAAFCPMCGASTAAGGAAAAPEKKKKARSAGTGKILLIGGVAIALIAAVVLLVCLLPGGSGNTAQIRQEFLVVCDNEDAVFYTKDRVKIGKDSEDFKIYRRAVTDGSVMLLSYPDETDDTAFELKRVTKDGVEKISAEASGPVVAATKSGSVLFREDVADGEGTLKKFNGKETETLAKNAYQYFCISPDGGAILYTANYDAGDASFDLYQKIGSKDAVKLGKELTPLGVSNGGKYIYYTKEKNGETTLCALIRGEEIKISKIESTASWVVFNAGMDEIAFCADEKSYVSKQGGEKIRIPGAEPSPFCGGYAATCQYGNGSDIYTYIYDMPSFGGRVWSDGDAAYYVDKKFDATRIFKTNTALDLSEDESTIVWIDDDAKLHIAKADKNAEKSEVEIDEDDVKSFRVSDDGKTVYFINTDGDLYVADSNGKKVTRVDRDVDQYIVVPGTSDCCYIKDYADNAGTLMRAKKNGESASIDGGKAAHSFMINWKDAYVRLDYEDGESDLYFIDGTTLVKVQSGVVSIY